MRLPSQWKSKVMPTILSERGVNMENYSKYLLKVLRSIYGEHDAQKLFAETIKHLNSLMIDCS